MTDWHRVGGIATYPGFNSYLERSGERTRFVIDAQIEHASDVPKLREFIKCMVTILALPWHDQQYEVDGEWAE